MVWILSLEDEPELGDLMSRHAASVTYDFEDSPNGLDREMRRENKRRHRKERKPGWVSVSTLRRWDRLDRRGGPAALLPGRPGPKDPPYEDTPTAFGAVLRRRGIRRSTERGSAVADAARRALGMMRT